MQVLFSDVKLEDLYYSWRSTKFHPEITKKFIDRVNFLKKSKDMRDVYAMVSFHCEKLTGDLDWKLSIRINKSRRIIFTVNQLWELQVISIEEISNHYQ